MEEGPSHECVDFSVKSGLGGGEKGEVGRRDVSSAFLQPQAFQDHNFPKVFCDHHLAFKVCLRRMASNAATWGSVRERRSKSAGEGTEIVVVTPDDPAVPFLLKDFDQECPPPTPHCAEFRKSEHRSLKAHHHLHPGDCQLPPLSPHPACYLSRSIKRINTEHVYGPEERQKQSQNDCVGWLASPPPPPSPLCVMIPLGTTHR